MKIFFKVIVYHWALFKNLFSLRLYHNEWKRHHFNLFFCSSSSLSIMPYYVLRKHCWVETVLKVQHCWTTLICTVACASQIIQKSHHYYWSYDRCWVMKTHFKIFRRLNQYGIQLRTHINCFVPHSDMQAEHFIFHHFSHLKRQVPATCIICIQIEGAFLASRPATDRLACPDPKVW